MKCSLLFCILIVATPGSALADLQAGSPDVEKTKWKIINPVAPPHREPIRMGGTFGPWEPIYKVNPAYPSDAIKSLISGVVVLQVVVNERGEVYEAQVIRGHPLLNGSALDALRQWKYKVSYFAGRPVPVLATVTVNFMLHPSPNVTCSHR